MKRISKKYVRFFILCCLYDLLLFATGHEYVYDCLFRKDYFHLLFFVWTPVVVPLLHELKINRKVLGNIVYELTVLLLPIVLLTCYFNTVSIFAYKDLAAHMDQVWYYDNTGLGIIIYALMLIFLVVHGRSKTCKEGDSMAMRIVVVIIILHFVAYWWRCQKSYYIPETGMYVKIERFPFMDIKVYFSKSNHYGNDYVTYKGNMPVSNVLMYFIEPSSIYVPKPVGIKQKEFSITVMEKPEEYTIYTSSRRYFTEAKTVCSDSLILYKPNYQLMFESDFSDFYVIDSHLNVLYDTRGDR